MIKSISNGRYYARNDSNGRHYTIFIVFGSLARNRSGLSSKFAKEVVYLTRLYTDAII